MDHSGHAIFDESVWAPALHKFGAVTHLTVTVYGPDGRIVCGPAPPTPLFALFREFGYTPPILSECLRDCFAQAVKEPAAVITEGYGVPVVVAPLRLEGRIVGAPSAGMRSRSRAVCGYRGARPSDVDSLQAIVGTCPARAAGAATPARLAR